MRTVRTVTAAVAATALAVAALTACDSTSSSAPPVTGAVASATPSTSAPAAEQEIGQPPGPQVGTGAGLIPIDSDNVQAAGYDVATGTMTVLFDSGGLYEYYAVPAELWDAFVAAQPHPWSAIGDPKLVKGGYKYTRIG